MILRAACCGWTTRNHPVQDLQWLSCRKSSLLNPALNSTVSDSPAFSNFIISIFHLESPFKFHPSGFVILFPIAPTTLTVLTNVCAGDTQILPDKYVNMGIPNFSLLLWKVQTFTSFTLTIIQHSLSEHSVDLSASGGSRYRGPVKLALFLFNRGQLRSSIQLPRQLIN